MRRKILKKLAGKGGFTLTELIVTTMVIVLLGLAVTTGISVATRAYTDVTMHSEANILGGTLAVELADELRFAQNISAPPGGPITFTSRRFGDGVSVAAVDGSVTIGGRPVLAEKTYTGLLADVRVEYVGGSFLVNITVSSVVRQLGSWDLSVTPISD